MIEENREVKGSHQLIAVTILLFFLQILLNFVGSPLVKYVFAAAMGATFLCVASQPFKKAIWILLIFSIFEGQGRIVWGYNAIFRIIFDLLSLVLIVRIILKHKKLIDRRFFSKLTILFLVLHFSWWIIELFNPNGAGFGPSFITAKYYIFPFILFLSFVTVGVEVEEKFSQVMILVIFIMMILIGLLCFQQQEMKNDLMLQVSPYYLSLFDKFKEFTGARFRPWGTAHSPGGMSIFNYLLIPLFFFFDPNQLSSVPLKKLLMRLVSYSFLLVSFASCFLSQVRSAFLKMIAIFVLIYLIRFVTSKFKVKQIILGILLIGGIAAYSPNLLQQEAFLGAIGRYDQLAEEGVGSQRSGPMEVFNHLLEKVDYPLGYGLGMTTGYSSAFQAKREEKIVTGARQADFWSLDNLYAFLFLELGLGAFFYIGFLFSVFSRLLMSLINVIKEKDVKAKEIGIAFSMLLILLLGDWGAVSIPFNPVSFSMWLWVAIGLRKMNMGREKEKVTTEN